MPSQENEPRARRTDDARDARRRDVRLPVLAFLVALLVLSTLKGLRFPNLWSATHFFFDYEFGFVRRGLAGALLATGDGAFLRSYAFVVLAGALLLAANLGFLLGALVRLVRNGGDLAICGALVFASSLAVVFLAHTIGYLDHAALLGALLLLAVEGFWRRILAAAFLVPILLLLHEAAFFVALPPVVLSLWLDTAESRKRVAALVALVVVTTGIAGAIGRATVSPAEAEEIHARIEAEVDFPPRRDAVAVLARSIPATLAQMTAIWSDPRVQLSLLVSLATTGPSILFLLWLALRELRSRGAGATGRGIAVVAALAPLALHLVAWDRHRWNTLAITTSFLVWYGVRRRFESGPAPPGPGNALLPWGVLALLLLNVSAELPLMDGYEVEHPPFRGHLRYLMDLAAGQAEFPAMPER